MRVILSAVILLLACCQQAAAQQFHGKVYDALTNAPIAGVLVTDTRSGALWLSDSAGQIAFTAFPGDIVRLERTGFKTYALPVTTYSQLISVPLERAPVELRGVEVRSPLARFREDSAFNRQFFHKELGYARSQVSFGSSNSGIGVGSSGLVSELALIVSGKRKAARRLEEEMLFLEGLQYSNIRYNANLVASQTGLPDSAAEAFIVRNPIPNEFLRAASEAELKMRIRETYRQELRTDSLRRAR